MSQSPYSNQNTPTLSVIVAAYNIERYIAQCLNSALDNQDHDFEILVVDDGSTDATARIIDDYGEHPRLRILRRDNGGLGAARNTGLDAARGRFVMFVDGDDWLAAGALDTCLSAIAAAPSADLLVFDYFDINEQGATRQFCPPNFWGCKNAAWNKIYAASLLHGERFDTDILYEDMARVRPWAARARRITRVDRALYNYRNMRSGSIMSSLDSRRFFDLLVATSRCVDRIETDHASGTLVETTHRLGDDWKKRLYTVDVFVPALVGWPRKLDNTDERRRFSSDFFSQLPHGAPDKQRLAREFGIKIAIAAACYERGAFAAGDLLLHRLGRAKRRMFGWLGRPPA